MFDRKKYSKSKDGYMAGTFEPEDIWINEVTPETAIEFCEKVKVRFNENPNIPIPIYINSMGGDVSAMFSMMDAMDTIRSMAPPSFYFVTIVTGEACSAAADILAHGDVRIALPKSSIMIHQSSGGAVGHIDDLKISIKEQERINDLAAKIFVENTNIQGGVAGYKKIASRDKYMNPEEAKALGIVDHVGYPRFEFVSFVRTIITSNENTSKNKDATKFLQVDEEPVIVQEEKPKRKKKVKGE